MVCHLKKLNLIDKLKFKYIFYYPPDPDIKLNGSLVRDYTQVRYYFSDLEKKNK